MSTRAVIIGIALLVGAAVAGNCYLDRQNEWEQRVVRVQEHARALEAAGEKHRARADSLQSVADEALSRAARRDTVIRVIRQEIADLPPEPDACRVFTEPRDRLISECELQVAEVREGLRAQTERGDELRRAEIAARTRGDSLLSVLEDRPKPRPSWLPALSAFAGVCTTGQLCAGAGLSWEIRIF